MLISKEVINNTLCELASFIGVRKCTNVTRLPNNRYLIDVVSENGTTYDSFIVHHIATHGTTELKYSIVDAVVNTLKMDKENVYKGIIEQLTKNSMQKRIDAQLFPNQHVVERHTIQGIELVCTRAFGNLDEHNIYMINLRKEVQTQARRLPYPNAMSYFNELLELIKSINIPNTEKEV